MLIEADEEYDRLKKKIKTKNDDENDSLKHKIKIEILKYYYGRTVNPNRALRIPSLRPNLVDYLYRWK